MILIKKQDTDTWVYRRKDEETEHYIIEDWMCNEYEMDYIEDLDWLKFYINTAMDDGTELEVIEAREVIDCPITNWYFIY